MNEGRNLHKSATTQLRTQQTVVRKRKLRASTYKGRNGLTWEHLNERSVGIGGFHVTQVSLIITQVKNKIAHHSIN